VVVISDGLWRRLGARPTVVGTDLRLDGESYTVIGVAQPELTLPGGADYWRPLVFTPHQLDESQRGANWVNVVARLKTGTSLAQANAAVTTVAEQLQVSAPRNFGNRRFALVRLRDRIVRDIRPALLVLFACSRPRAADRVRQCRKSASRTRLRPGTRSGRTRGGRRRAAPPRSAIRCGKPGAGWRRRAGRLAGGRLVNPRARRGRTGEASRGLWTSEWTGVFWPSRSALRS
jgi:hypothetical protein